MEIRLAKFVEHHVTSDGRKHTVTGPPVLQVKPDLFDDWMDVPVEEVHIDFVHAEPYIKKTRTWEEKQQDKLGEGFE